MAANVLIMFEFEGRTFNALRGKFKLAFQTPWQASLGGTSWKI